MSPLLEKIRTPADLKQLNADELEKLAAEIREFLIQTVSCTGGHLAPSLGAVELTLALHAVFDTPKDKIVWDVGHQAYAHKILTGRRDRFHTLRQYKGISGFPKVTESEYDAFGVGHASTAISAALGLVAARDLRKEDFKVIAVVGDGALTGGLAFEGLNNAGDSKRDLIVVLNDNQMSISPNVGALSKHLTKIIAAPLYNRIKDLLWAWTGKMAKGSREVRSAIHKIEEGLKAMMLPGSLFERLGFRYFGPLDGHDLPQMMRVFREIRQLHGPVLIHLITTKGKGYSFAEEDAVKFHGLSSFCLETGDTAVTEKSDLHRIVRQCHDRAGGKGRPDRGHHGGHGGRHRSEPIRQTVSRSFLRRGHRRGACRHLRRRRSRCRACVRSWPSIPPFSSGPSTRYIHDVALQNLPVVFAVDRAGLVGEDGPTHHGSFDLSYLRLVPNMVVMAPMDGRELRNMLFTAMKHEMGPVAVRYPRGETIGPSWTAGAFEAVPMGKGEIIQEGQDAAVLAIGQTVQPALKAAGILSQKGVFVRVINARFMKPIDRELILDTAKRFSILLTVEDNTVTGGFGDAVADVLTEAGLLPGVHLAKAGIPDRFIQHGSLGELRSEIGLDAEHLVQKIEQLLYRHQQNKKKISSTP